MAIVTLYQCPDMARFAQFAGGLIYDLGGGTRRIIPLSHPDYPGLLCKGIKCQATGEPYQGPLPTGLQSSGAMAGSTQPGFGVNQPWNLLPTSPGRLYSHAKIVCTFKSVPYGNDGATPFLTVRAVGSSEQVTIPGTGYTFTSDGSPIKQDSSFAIATTTYNVTIFQAVGVDEALYATLAANPVNSIPFLNFDAGTLRFDTWEYTQTQNSNFAKSYQIGFNFSWRAIPWNRVLRPDGIWESPVRTVDGGALYGTSDLNVLLN
jgi:hypothetical protein